MRIQGVLLLVCLLLFSCSKEDDSNYTLKNHGNVKVQVKDGRGNALPNVILNLYQLPLNYAKILLGTRTSDANGMVDFGRQNSNNYQIIAEPMQMEKVVYAPQMKFQVLAGKDENIELNVTEQTGTVKIKVENYDPETNITTPASNKGVLIMSDPNYYQLANVTDKTLEIAQFQGSTNEGGIVSFAIPAYVIYYLILYDKSSRKIIHTDGFNLVKGEVINPVYALWPY